MRAFGAGGREIQCFSKEFYTTRIQPVMQRWKKCIDDGDMWKSNLNFVKDIPMIYLNFIVIISNSC